MVKRTIEGIEVENAESDYMLMVAEKEAKEGKPMDVERCPAGLACVAMKDGTIKAKVYKSRCFMLRYNEDAELRWYMYVVPGSLKIQEAVIDNGGRFSPGRYLLKAPSPTKRVGIGEQGTKTRPLKDDPNAPKREPHITPMRENAPTRST